MDKKMTETEQILRIGMARQKITSITELGSRIGRKQQWMSKKKINPGTLRCADLALIAIQLKLSKEEIADFVLNSRNNL